MTSITGFRTAHPYKGVVVTGDDRDVTFWIADRIGVDTVWKIRHNEGTAIFNAFILGEWNPSQTTAISGSLSDLYTSATSGPDFTGGQYGGFDWHIVSGMPDGDLGRNGDRAIDLSGPTYYAKNDGAWTATTAPTHVPLPVYVVSDDDLGNPTNPSASSIRSHANALAAAFGRQEHYEGPRRPIISSITQGDMQAIFHIREDRRRFHELTPRFHLGYRPLNVTGGTDVTSNIFEIADDYNAIGVYNGAQGGLSFVRSKESDISGQAYELERIYLNDTGDVQSREAFTFTNLPSSQNSDDSSVYCNHIAAASGLDWIVTRRTDSNGILKTALMERQNDGTTFRYRRDVFPPNHVIHDLGRREPQLGTFGAYYVHDNASLRFLEFDDGSTAIIGLIAYPSELTGVSVDVEAIFGIQRTIYFIGVRGDEDNPRIYMWKVEFDGTPEAEYLGQVTGMQWPSSSSRVLDVRATEQGGQTFISMTHRDGNDIEETHLYRGIVSESGMALTFLAVLDDPEITQGGSILSLDPSLATDEPGEVVFSDDDATEITALRVHYETTDNIEVTATYATGFSLGSRTIHINGRSLSGSGPWTFNRISDSTDFTLFNGLRAGGTLSIVIGNGVSVSTGGWNAYGSPIVENGMTFTIENLVNDQVFWYRAWIEDGGRHRLNPDVDLSGSQLESYTLARAPSAPPPIPLTGTNTNEGVLLQWDGDLDPTVLEYQLQYRRSATDDDGDDVAWQTILSGTLQNEYLVTGLTNLETAEFRLLARN